MSKNSWLKLCFLFFSTILSLSAKESSEKKPDEVFRNVVNEHIGHFTDPTKLTGPSAFPFESLVASATVNSKNDHLPEVIFGDFKKAFVKMTIYSSPTCTHCAEYHDQVMPELLKMCESGDLVLVCRSFIANLRWDLIACKISWAKGVKHQFQFMSQILKDQKKWLLPSVHTNDDEKAVYVNQLKETLKTVSEQTKIPVEQLQSQLKITEDDPCGLLKLYALTILQIDFDLLVKVLNNEEMERDVLRMTLGAKDEKGNLLNFTPAIYIQKHPAQTLDQGTLQARNLEVEAVQKLVMEAKAEAGNIPNKF
jgi:hypothetical protein